MDAIALRLQPGADLKLALVDYCCDRQIAAACILSGVGSLRRAAIRFADRAEPSVWEERLEIVSLVGTLSQFGAHLHIAVADRDGRVAGGHLMPGALIHTTGEILLGVLPELCFQRVFDPATGYRELQIDSKTVECDDC